MSQRPIRLHSRAGLWQFWSLSTNPEYVWLAPLDPPARRSLSKKGAEVPLLEVASSDIQEERPDEAQPTLF